MSSSNSFEVSDSIQSLQTAQQAELLDKVDSLRLNRVGEFTNLPQLVVCGDQSSGKSSVLEAISGIPFPKQDTLCTRFATEVILRRTHHESISVSIVPASDCPSLERQRLLSFRHDLSSRNDFPKLFESVTSVITAPRTFSKNILRVELCGPTQPQLTLVDLPGLIHSDASSTSSENIELVSDLVDGYLRNPRSVILAIISAMSDTSNQAILKKARDVDPRGLRTLGIITKPDRLNRNSRSETAFLNLARNMEYIFNLGWHVVRNLDSAAEQIVPIKRDEEESLFFKNSNFRILRPDQVGITALRTRLSKVLFDQIRVELPKLIEEIESNVISCRLELEKLGPGREGVDEQRKFLIGLSQSFQAICHDAVRGYYDHSFFRIDTNPTRRLCAKIMNEHSGFAKNLRDNGALWKIVQEKGTNGRERTREEAISEACELLKRSRGQELPGLPNPLVVGELFREYSRPWEGLAKQHIQQVWKLVCIFLELLLQHLTDGDVSDAILRLLLLPKMEARLKSANNKLNELVSVHMYPPMTTNVAFADNRKRFQLQFLKKGLKEKFGTESTSSHKDLMLDDLSRLVNYLGVKTVLDMDIVAAEDAFDNMNAFYQVAMNLFTDNVPTLAIHAPIIREVPDLFCPNVIAGMEPDLVKRIASESEEKILKRNDLQSQLNTLETGLQICKNNTLPLQLASLDSGYHESRTSNSADPINRLPDTPAISTTVSDPSSTTRLAGQLSLPSLDHSEEQSSAPTDRTSKSASRRPKVCLPKPPTASVSPSASVANQSQNTTSALADLPNPTLNLPAFDVSSSAETSASSSPAVPPASTSVFGSSNATETRLNPSSEIGSQKPQPAFGSSVPNTPSLFASLSTPKKDSSTGFGTFNFGGGNIPGKDPPSGFGALNPTDGSIFGRSNSPRTDSQSTVAAAPVASGSLFGTSGKQPPSTVAAAAPSASGSLFAGFSTSGNQPLSTVAAAPSASGSLFGSPAATSANTKSYGGFGSWPATSASPQSSNPFGKSSSTSSFSATSASPESSSIFGSTSATSASPKPSSLFGSTSATSASPKPSSLFGSASATSASLFGPSSATSASTKSSADKTSPK